MRTVAGRLARMPDHVRQRLLDDPEGGLVDRRRESVEVRGRPLDGNLAAGGTQCTDQIVEPAQTRTRCPRLVWTRLPEDLQGRPQFGQRLLAGPLDRLQ